MKLWIDDVRTPPNGDWLWAKSVNEAKAAISMYEHNLKDDAILISLDHDAGDYAKHGGDYVKVLDWLEEQDIVDTGYFFNLHSMNPVGVQNMRNIIEHNGWKEIRI